MTVSAKPQDSTGNESAPDDSDMNQTATDSADNLSLDETFEILKNNRRRIVLKHLQQRGETTLGELADHVTAVENDTDVDSITSTQRKRVYVGLYQFHLPKMSDMGVIEFDQDRGDIQLTEQGRELIESHEQEQSPDQRWHRLSLGLTGFGLVGVVVSLLTQIFAVAVGFLTLQTLLSAVLGFLQRRREQGE